MVFGIILASLGIPLAMNLLPKRFGKGLQVDKTRQRRSIPIHVPKKGDGRFFAYEDSGKG